MNVDVTITRKSRNIGYGYTCTVHQTDKGLVVDKVDKPDFTGTFGTVSAKIASDKTLESIKSGGTYWNYQWFVKLNHVWYPIQNDRQLDMLYCKYGDGYYSDSIVLKVVVPEDYDIVKTNKFDLIG